VNVYLSVYIDGIIKKYSLYLPLEVITAVIKTLLVLFGEIIPKTLAKNYAANVSIPFLTAFRIFYYLLWIPTYFTSIITHFINSMFIKKGAKSNPQMTADELEFIINESEEQGVIEEHKHDMLNAVFELAETVVREIMVHRTDMIALKVTSRVIDSVECFKETGFSRIPVFDDKVDNIVGFVHIKDILFFLKNNRDSAVYWEGV
jgi:putative hemolysin